MKNYLSKLSFPCILCLPIFLGGCCVQIGCPMLAKYQRHAQLSAPLAPGSTFAARTHNGYVTITGADVADCNLTATIIARSVTEEDAKKLVEQIKITLDSSGNRLTARIDKPAFMMNQSVTVNLNVIVPNQTSLELVTHNGAVTISDITGQTNATTHNGSVTASNISGDTDLKTHNGRITCRQISGDTNLRTHNGSINLDCQAALPACDISAVTHNGGVEFTAPPDFSAAVEISTHNGSVNTDLPITIIGKVSRRQITGKIGTGEGKLHLQTHNGSIRIE